MSNNNNRVDADWERRELIPFLRRVIEGRRHGYGQGHDWVREVHNAESRINTIADIDDSDITIERIRQGLNQPGVFSPTDTGLLQHIVNDVRLVITIFVRHAINHGPYQLASLGNSINEPVVQRMRNLRQAGQQLPAIRASPTGRGGQVAGGIAWSPPTTPSRSGTQRGFSQSPQAGPSSPRQQRSPPNVRFDLPQGSPTTDPIVGRSFFDIASSTAATVPQGVVPNSPELRRAAQNLYGSIGQTLSGSPPAGQAQAMFQGGSAFGGGQYQGTAFAMPPPPQQPGSLGLQDAWQQQQQQRRQQQQQQEQQLQRNLGSNVSNTPGYWMRPSSEEQEDPEDAPQPGQRRRRPDSGFDGACDEPDEAGAVLLRPDAPAFVPGCAWPDTGSDAGSCK